MRYLRHLRSLFVYLFALGWGFVLCSCGQDSDKTDLNNVEKAKKHSATASNLANPRTQNLELIVQSTQNYHRTYLAFSPDGKLLATGGRIIQIWDIATGQQVRQLTKPLDSSSVAFSPDGKILAAGYRKMVKLWNVNTGKEIHTFVGTKEKYDRVTSVAFNRDGKFLAAGCGKIAKVWNIANKKQMSALKGNAGGIYCIAFSPANSKILVCGYSRSIKLWDITTRKTIRSLTRFSTMVNAIAFHPQGKLLANLCLLKKNATLWDVTSGRRVRFFSHSKKVRSRRVITAINFSPEGKMFGTGDSLGSIKLWNVKTGREIRSFSKNYSTINALAFSPDKKILATSHSSGIDLWDVATGRAVRSLIGHTSRVRFVSFNPAGKTLAIGDFDGTIQLWNMATGKSTHFFSAGRSSFSNMVFSPNGKIIATGTTSSSIKLWDTTTGGIVYSFPEYSNSISYSPDGKMLANIDGREHRTIKIREIATNRKIHSLTGHTRSINRVLFSPDGKMLVSCSFDKTIRLWDVIIGKQIHLLEGHTEDIKQLSYSPDGKVLAGSGGSRDYTVKLWDAYTGKKIRSLMGHTGAIYVIKFSPNGQVLATGSVDSTVKLWSVNTGNELCTLSGHIDSVTALSYSPDGKILASGGTDGKINLWNIKKEEKLATMICVRGPDFIVTTPENYYMATPGALRSVTFTIGNRAFPFGQFDLKFNRPDLVLKRIGYSPKTLLQAYYLAYKKRLKKMNFTTAMLTDMAHVPKIKITNNLPAATRQKNLHFKIKAQDTKYLLDRINVYVNEVPIYGRDGISVRDQKKHNITQQIKLELSSGQNKIQVSVFNNQGVESLRETLKITYTGNSTPPHLYVVAIGVSQYASRQYNLRYAAKDARDLASFFENNIDRTHVLRILDSTATKENIIQAKAFLNRSAVDDQVILFFAGHGLLDKNMDYYFGTTDINFANPSQRGLSYEAMETLLDGIPARKKLLLIDTCHSGEVDKTKLDPRELQLAQHIVAQSFEATPLGNKKMRLGLQNSVDLLNELFIDLRRGSGALVIAAASGRSLALESSEWKNGIFTYAILEGLKTKKADKNRDHKIWVSELKDYVIKKVGELTNNRQIPTSRRDSLEFDFKVYY